MPQIIQKDAFIISQQLSENIFSSHLNIRGLTGWKGIFRVIVIKNYRMIYSFDKERLYLLRIAHRKEIYRNLKL
ncbi:hypothetical protein GMMP15_190032 [Candidatus Magnetomoraceae bacterium gMMP-15]